MNREIKFRVWDGDKMYYSKGGLLSPVWDKNEGTYLMQILEEENGTSRAADENNSNTMQFTGLKDKNGKEIYEGDVVEQEKWVSVGVYKPTIGIVKYASCKFYSDCIGDWEGSHADLNGNATVIGNIYENPELLNK